MYKGIIDSGWVNVNSLTVFVGKNESGKTSLLKALYKLNPYNPEPYQIAKEWPRSRRIEQDDTQEVCRAKFQLTNQEQSELLQITEQETFPDILEISRNYAGQLEVKFEEEIYSDKPYSKDIDVTFDILPEIQDNFSEQFKLQANECINEVRHLANEGQYTEFTPLVKKHVTLLRKKRVQQDSPTYSIEGRFINQYHEGFSQIIQTLQQLPTDQSKVQKYVIGHLPTFIYMDDYKTFSGNAYLKDIQERQTGSRLTESDKTFLTILELSGLDFDELVQLGQGGTETRKQRKFDLDDGGTTLTKIISERLSQRKYRVEYHLDGEDFYTFVKDDYDPSLIELEERSKGFQWFFSFDLMFMHESDGIFEGCVVLLDEPGLHLHPMAQKDLLVRLEDYASANTLLYTTHLPFMVDLNHPERIRVLKETKNGIENNIVVTTDFSESPPGAKLVLQAALGMDASQSILVAKRNLVVEGAHDYWILTTLSNLLKQNGGKGLPDDVRITPGASASEAVNVAKFMIGQNLDVVALFDSDQEGKNAKNKLVEKWLTQYKNTNTKVILLGDAVDTSGDFAIEDLFTEDFTAEIVKETYNKELAKIDVAQITLQGEGMMKKRIEGFLQGMDIKFNEGSVAKRLRNKLSNMKDISELPEETIEKATKVFQEIRNAFGEQE